MANKPETPEERRKRLGSQGEYFKRQFSDQYETPEEMEERLGPYGMAHRRWHLDGCPVRRDKK